LKTQLYDLLIVIRSKFKYKNQEKVQAFQAFHNKHAGIIPPMISPREFHPEIVSRRGEFITWVLALISLATLVFLWVQAVGVSIWQIAFIGLMILAAASSSLSNWMDRKTVLSIKPEGILFCNGLRDVSLTWDKIQALQVFPSRFGKGVVVIGDQSHFNFRTMVEITQKSGNRSVMGFTQGEFIIQHIIKNSDLNETEQNEKGRYYARL
jgi:hypothetical protein